MITHTALAIPAQLDSYEDVDRLLTIINVLEPTTDSRRALRMGREWMYSANHSARTKSATPVQQYLMRHWMVPFWGKKAGTSGTPNSSAALGFPNTPRLNDPLETWVNHYNIYLQAPLPLGVTRDPEGRINVDLLRGHLLTLALLGHGPRRTHIRRDGQYALAGLFVDHHVYTAQLQLAGIEPESEVSLQPLPTLLNGTNASRDSVDLSTRALTIQSALSGITPDMVRSSLTPWARSFLDAYPAPTGPTIQAAPDTANAAPATAVPAQTLNDTLIPSVESSSSTDASVTGENDAATGPHDSTTPIIAAEDADAIMEDIAALFGAESGPFDNEAFPF